MKEALLLRRRRSFESEDILPQHDSLLYYWDAADDLVDNYWVDRVSGCKFQAVRPLKVDGMWYCNGTRVSGSTSGRYFYTSSLNSGDGKIVLPTTWICDVVFKPDMTSAFVFPIDLGSHASSSHAFGLQVFVSGGTIEVAINYKPLGNNSVGTYGLSRHIALSSDGVARVIFGTLLQQDGNLLLFCTANGETVYGKASHSSCTYSGNWNNAVGYFGSSVSSNSSTNVTGICMIKSIKFYEGLPYEEQSSYDAEVEYLQSDGSQYVDTEVVLTKNYSIITDCAVISGTNYPTVIGAQSAAGVYSIVLAYNDSGHPYTQVSQTYAYLYTTSKFGSSLTHYTLTGDGSKQYISDGEKTSSANFGSTLSSMSLFIFARHRYDTNAGNYAVAKIGKVGITIGGVLQRDFIPVRVGQVGYFYDKVSKRLFGNAGTGSFVLGPDITT